MTYTVYFLYGAELDLKEIKKYIVNNFSNKIWEETYTQIKQSIQVTQQFPHSGHIPEELENLNLVHYRQVISGRNRIIYEIQEMNIYIHLINDTRKSLKLLLERRLLKDDLLGNI